MLFHEISQNTLSLEFRNRIYQDPINVLWVANSVCRCLHHFVRVIELLTLGLVETPHGIIRNPTCGIMAIATVTGVACPAVRTLEGGSVLM